VKHAVTDFFDDDAMTLGAGLAFYSALSLAPLLVIALWIASIVSPSAREQIITQLTNLVGPEGGEAIRTIVENAAASPNLGTIAGIIGIATLLFSAAGVFGQLQHALNIIWDVKPKPGQGLWGWVRKRILSFGMLFGILFLLLVSLALSATITAMTQTIGGAVAGNEIVLRAIDLVASLFIITLLFAAIYRYLPDVRIEWSDVWGGAFATAILFVAGKFAIGLYLGHSSVGSAYGAAGSLVVLLVWVYYSSLIVFFGAELTQAGAREFGHAIVPDEYAIWADRKLEHASPRAVENGHEVPAADHPRTIPT
jgi:membrane protein